MDEASARPTSLGELARLFLRLGITGFGGPAAHVAMLRDEVVVRRGWMSEAHFLDLLGATNLIPGPNSTEMALHVGRERCGWRGLLVAGAAFIAPAAVITAALAWVYVRYGSLPSTQWILWGIKPVIVAIVAHALFALAPRAARTWSLRAIGAGALAAAAFGAHELLVLLAAGLIASLAVAAWRGAACTAVVPVAATSIAASSVTLSGIFWVFLKIGSVLFGSGYVLVAFLRADLVERHGWLTEAQLIDAVAAGQVTPGPVLSTATFIGYLLASWNGALLATLGIFLPAFVFVALSGPLVPRIRESRFAGAFLDGVTVASLALMALVTFQIGRSALVDVPAVAIAAAALVALVRFRVNATWLVAAGALTGVLKLWTG
jgi:chromate transporter